MTLNQCPVLLAVAAAGHVHFQGSESNHRWHTVVVPSSVLTSEVTESAGSARSWTLSGSRPGPPLESGMAMVVYPCLLFMEP